MRYLALVADYDGTLAQRGTVAESTLQAMKTLKRSGRKLILCTGRELPHLREVFPECDIFDLIIAENGGVFFNPETREEKLLTASPPKHFAEALRARGVAPLSVGRTIVATWEPHQTAVLDEIHRLDLPLQVNFNKGAVMVLPIGVGKGSGLGYALKTLFLSEHNIVGIGDAENDHDFLNFCEFSVATANATEFLKTQVDRVTEREYGAGVEELIEQLLADDLRSWTTPRQNIFIGKDDEQNPVIISPNGENVLITGESGSGKTRFASSLIETLRKRRLQICVIDPEGDYDNEFLAIGDAKTPPSIDQIVRTLRNPTENISVNLLAVRLEDRPRFLLDLMPRLQELYSKYGRPHWLVIDEAHHLLEKTNKASREIPLTNSMIMITMKSETLPDPILQRVTKFIEIQSHRRALCRQHGEPARLFTIELPEAAHLRHRRKYSDGELEPDRSFYFRGPKARLNLRAHNLMTFLQMSDGVDDETWMFHRRRHDFSTWFRNGIKDDDLAEAAMKIESNAGFNTARAKQEIRELVQTQYTGPGF